MYYNYHGIIKTRIKNDELKSYSIVDDYHGIRPALLLEFKDGSIKPIREYRFHEYFELIDRYYSFDSNLLR